MEYLDQEYTIFVNKSYSKQFSKNQYIVKVLPNYINCEDTILDFGAGTDTFGAKTLHEKGYNVTSWDIGKNTVPGNHSVDALDKKYDVIVCSNVLNIQPSEKDVVNLLSLLSNLLDIGGRLFCNFPRKPRYNGYTTKRLETTLQMLFVVKTLAKDPPAWICKQKIRLLFKCDSCHRDFFKEDSGEPLSNCPYCGEEAHYTEYFEEMI
jgi:2-polyprenyl-3-methyl-5-hydroxy-6-metoxy-1,4-benzoquinol methylase